MSPIYIPISMGSWWYIYMHCRLCCLPFFRTTAAAAAAASTTVVVVVGAAAVVHSSRVRAFRAPE